MSQFLRKLRCNQFEKTVITEKTFDQAVAAIEKKAAEKGFRVLHTHYVAATLSEKGFPRSPLKIIEICNAKYASQVLGQHDNDLPACELRWGGEPRRHCYSGTARDPRQNPRLASETASHFRLPHEIDNAVIATPEANYIIPRRHAGK